MRRRPSSYGAQRGYVPESDTVMGRKKTSNDLAARARRLAAAANIPYTAALASLRTPRTARPPIQPPQPAATAGHGPLGGLLGPLRPGTLTVLAGRTMSGTTALALGVARHNLAGGLPVVLAELQSSPRATHRMLLAAESGQDLDRTAAQPPDRARLAEAADRTGRWPLRLVRPGHDAFSRLGAAARDIGARLIVIDDLGLAGDPGQDLSPDSAGARAASLAAALDIPVVATTHLGPYPGDVPRPADLRYPRILEHADHLVLLHRPVLHSPAVGRPDLVTCHVTGRAGAELGQVTLRFEPEFHRMTGRG